MFCVVACVVLYRYNSTPLTLSPTSDVSIRSRRAGVLDQRIEMSRYSCVRGSWLDQQIRSFDSMYVHTPLQTRLSMCALCTCACDMQANGDRF